MIDPNIALQVRPVQTSDPLEAAGRVLSLKNLVQQGKMGDIQMQQAQAELQDQQKARQAWMDSKGDPDLFLRRASELGVGPKTLQAIQQHAATVKKTLLEMDDKQVSINAAHEKAMKDAIDNVLLAPPEKQPAMYAQTRAALIQAGHLKPEQAPEQFPGAEWLSAHANGMTLFNAEMKRREDQRAAAEHTAKLPGMQAQSEQQQLQLTGQTAAPIANQADWDAWRASLPAETQKRVPVMFSGAARELVQRMGMTPEQQFSADQAAQRIAGEAAGRAETANYHKGMLGIAREGLNIRRADADPYGQMGINPHPIGGGRAADLSGEEYLKTLPPALSARVRAIAEGRDSIPVGRAATSGAGKAVVDAVYRYDPGFTTQRAQIRKAFTSGNDGRNIGALNTATVHLDQLGEAAKALKNGTWTPGNAAYNAMASAFGSAAVSNFELLKSAVAGEMANALKGNATDIEIRHVSEPIKAAGSPEALAGAVKTGLHTLAAKLNTYDERYQQQIPGDSWSPVLPSAQAVYSKHGIQPIVRTSGEQRSTAGGKPPLGSFERR